MTGRQKRRGSHALLGLVVFGLAAISMQSASASHRTPSADGKRPVSGHATAALVPVQGGNAGLNELWRVQHQTSTKAPVVLSGNVVVVVDADGIEAFAADSGQTLWTHDLGEAVGNALDNDSTNVYEGTGEGGSAAFDLHTGEQVWSTTACGSRVAGLTVAATTVYEVCTNPAEVVALRSDSGDQIWRQPIAGVGVGAPTVAGDRVLVETSALTALDTTTGSPLWTTTTSGPDRASRSVPAVSASTVFVGTGDGRLIAADVATGAIMWTVVIDEAGGPVGASPLVSGGTVYEPNERAEGSLYAVDADTGAVRWTFPVQTDGSAAMGTGTVYLGTVDGYLDAIDPATGALVGSTANAGSTWTAPVLDGNGDLYYVGWSLIAYQGAS